LASIFPFKALLPAIGNEALVSANTHVDDLKRQMEIVRDNPLTYLNVVKPYLKFNEEKNPIKHFPYGLSALHELIAMKAMALDSDSSLYIYIQTDKINGSHEYIGLICTVPVEDYYEGRIKIHEKTLTEKEEQLIMHIEVTGVIGEPVLMTHKPASLVSDILKSYSTQGEEIIHFHDEVDRIHRIIKICDLELIKSLQNAYAGIGDIYIADGHHRSAASAGYFKKRGIVNGHYLSYIVPPEYLNIDSFHRAYKSQSTFDDHTFLSLLAADFTVSKSSTPILPQRELTFGLRLKGQWYQLDYNKGIAGLNAVDSLDVSILEDHVFKSKLHIRDSKTDTQLSFLKGSIPCETLEAEVEAGIYDAVFTVHPCHIQHVFDVADQGLIMPPKSTYIEPKLRTGLTVQMV
jgi:uncharacterized protein (DUF1015 family)